MAPFHAWLMHSGLSLQPLGPVEVTNLGAGHKCSLVAPILYCPWGAELTPCCFAGGPESSKVVPGNTSSFDILNLEGGVTYIVKVTALIGNRESNPVSITVTTRRFQPCAVRSPAGGKTCPVVSGWQPPRGPWAGAVQCTGVRGLSRWWFWERQSPSWGRHPVSPYEQP